MKSLINNPQAKYFSRELSWLAFNDRVLEEAADSRNPLLERVKYLAIVSTNLEEFFRVRVAGLLRKKQEQRSTNTDPEGRNLNHLLVIIRNWVYEQKHRQAQLFDQLVYELAREGFFIETAPSPLAKEVFIDQVLPFISSLAIPAGELLPPIHNGRLYLLAHHSDSHSLIEIPTQLPRWILRKNRHAFLVDRLIHSYRDLIFKSQEVKEMFAFKVSRDAELDIDEDADDPLKEVEESIKDRDFGPIVRVEVDSLSLSDSLQWLQTQLHAPLDSVYQLSLPLDLKFLMTIYQVRGFKKLRFRFPEPRRPRGFKRQLSSSAYFKKLDSHDILLHHPYDSFDPVVELVQAAADDPKVTRICQTLYRTSGKSAVLEALIRGALKGKKVSVLVELKARFDEANNIRLARSLERAGVEVIYGSPDFKVHAKLIYIERKVKSEIKGYTHVSTGNYHPRTARSYTDIGLITSNPLYARDAKFLFDAFEEMKARDDFNMILDDQNFASRFRCWKVAPTSLHDTILELIQREIRFAKAKQPARIRAKMNGLVDEKVIDALYSASQAGVKIDLFVRGMNCLRPGLSGLSENIRVRSVVDKYLEHSRVFIFENGGEPQVWLSSADWMPRNFFRRLEIAVPILNPAIANYLSTIFWNCYDRDNTHARECYSDGTYHRLVGRASREYRAQTAFEKLDVPAFKATHLLDL